MKYLTNLIIFFCFNIARPVHTIAQQEVRTVVPQKPVIVGEPFQVQFIVEDDKEVKDFAAPSFKGFRIISGPNIYKGKETGQFGKTLVNKNITYTLVPLIPGSFIIGPAKIIRGGVTINSKPVSLKVISKREANILLQKEKNFLENFSGYRLLPGEDPYKKIEQNLFLKLMVDKKSCFVGEPVLATFKLYSRLQSKSDIVKNPGLYGFTVHDIINLDDRFLVTEKINGKDFDVHTIRQMQLFPLQAGTFTIDPMEIVNRVEFTRSTVYKKTEQQIAEGVLGIDEASPGTAGTEVYETAMHTEPVNITVKSLPVNSPPTFSSAVGNFSIIASLSANSLAINVEGYLNVMIKGAGNFPQINAPVVSWPEGFEGFDPLVNDSLSKSASVITGYRIFRFPFVSSRPGQYTIPAMEFSFFNIDSGRYKTIKTTAENITITNEPKNYKPDNDANKRTVKGGKSNGVLLTLLFAGLTGIIVLYLIYFKKKNRPAEIKKELHNPDLSGEGLLLPAIINLQADDKIFYSSLHQSLWGFLGSRFHLSGSELNKEKLFEKLKGHGASNELVVMIHQILEKCEEGQFTNVPLQVDREKLIEQARHIIQSLRHPLL